MPRHDSVFKKLLEDFLADLLRLAVPDLAGRLDLTNPVFLKQEFITIQGQQKLVDLLAKVPVLGADGGLLLLHVEVEARASAEMAWRLWRYRNHIQAAHDTRVVTIVLYLDRGQAGVRVRALEDDLFDMGFVDFTYIAFGLAGCAAGEYLARPEPLAWALAALMRRGSLTRPELKLACLRRIAAADLSDARRLRLVNCVDAYLELNSEEEAQYARLCTVRENREVKKMAMTWSERLEAKGMEKGLQALKRVLLRLLEQRFGPLPEETRERVEAISSLDRLTRLSERVLTARSLAALRLQ
jgi:putative YhgA-like transposase